jgi:hypothetical protein
MAHGGRGAAESRKRRGDGLLVEYRRPTPERAAASRLLRGLASPLADGPSSPFVASMLGT